MSRSRRAARDCAVIVALVLTVALLAGCEQKMGDQPSYRPLEESSFFGDSSSAQPLPTGVVPREAELDEQLTTGAIDGQVATTIPFAVTDDVVARGAERFAIFCVPCHGAAALGDGVVVQHGFTRPPPLTAGPVAEAPVGRLFQVITSGAGAMPAYGTMIPPRDRWAIVAYLRTLQAQAAANPIPATTSTTEAGG